MSSKGMTLLQVKAYPKVAYQKICEKADEITALKSQLEAATQQWAGPEGILISNISGKYLVTIQTDGSSDINYLTLCAQDICRNLPTPPNK